MSLKERLRQEIRRKNPAPSAGRVLFFLPFFTILSRARLLALFFLPAAGREAPSASPVESQLGSLAAFFPTGAGQPPGIHISRAKFVHSLSFFACSLFERESRVNPSRAPAWLTRIP